MSVRLGFAALLAASISAPALGQSTSMLSANPGQGNADSTLGPGRRAVTPDGRFVVFSSLASNLVAGDTLGLSDVFVRDRTTGAIERVSTTTSGAEANGASFDGVISDDGRFVAFSSDATNLAAGDFNFATDVFVRDRTTGLTTIVSASSLGVIGDAASARPSISGDGLRIAFQSAATNLVGADLNGKIDVFVRNQSTNKVRLATSGPAGQANGDCTAPSISSNGRWIAFETLANNLVASDTQAFREILLFDYATGSIERAGLTNGGLEPNGDCDQPSVSFDGKRIAFSSVATDLGAPSGRHVFLRDRLAGTTSLIDRTPQGAPGNGDGSQPSLSSNGLYIAYASRATNLVPNDTGNVADAYVASITPPFHQRASVTTGMGTTDPSQPIDVIGGVSDDGRFVPFASKANNLVNGDNGGFSDVFQRDLQRSWHVDVDADLYGDPAVFQLSSFPVPGHVLDATDCDDGNASIHPNAQEICNGVDDDCDQSIDEENWESFCFSSTSQHGCSPHLNVTGVPSASASSGFVFDVTGIDGQRSGALLYSQGQTQVAWAFGSTSIRCLMYPWARVETVTTGGTAGQCDGAYAVDWLVFMAANPGALGQPIGAGDVFYVQGWYRDPGAPKNSNLTDAISFSVCP